LREQVRAALYIDKAISPILAVTEDSLREAHRGAFHPYRNVKYGDARARPRLWVVAERQRAIELEFLQGARARITVAVLHPVGARESPTVFDPIVAPRP
jgi:hypothetical protein